MTKPIDRFVSENRQNIKKIDSTFVPISVQSSRNLSFTDNSIRVTSEIEVYTRPLNDGLVSGHPNGDVHGSGQGKSGDHRGPWSLVEDSEEARQFLKGGRNSVRDTLAAVSDSYIGKMAVGSGSSNPLPTDSSLDSENGRVFSWPNPGNESNQSEAESIFLFSEYGDDISEYSVYSAGDTIYNRIVTETVSPTEEEEVRVVSTFTVEGDGTGNSVITDIGEDRIAHSFRSIDSPIALNEMRFGDGSSTPQESDTGLDSENFSTFISRERSPETITAQAVVLEIEPSNQPVDISEIGVFDNDGNMIWRTVLDSFEKNGESKFDAFVGFRIK